MMNKLLNNLMIGTLLAAPLTILPAQSKPVTEITVDNVKNAHEHAMRPNDHRKKSGVKGFARMLDLTYEQKVQIKAIREQAKVERDAQKAEMKIYREQIQVLMQSDSFDEASFIALHNQYQDTFAQSAVIRAKTKHAIFQILSEEQKQKAKLMHNKRKKRRNFSL